jgi:putative protein-disulfide isomerase
MEAINKSQLNCDIDTGVCEVPQTTPLSNNSIIQKPVKLLYFTDPICSSCWGIEPQLRKLKQEYGQYFDMDYRMGGLLKSWDEYGGSDVNGPISVAKHWDDAGKYYQMPIDGDIWLTDPLPSSYLPSMAFKAAQLQGNEKAHQFLRRMKEMVFTEKINIARKENLLSAAKDIDLDLQRFESDLQQPAKQLFEEDLALARAKDVRGFPTIFFIDNNNNQFKVYGSKPYELYESALLKLIEGPVVKNATNVLTDILKHYPTVTLREFEVFFNLSTEEALLALNKMVAENQLMKSETKAGPIWKEVNLFNHS